MILKSSGNSCYQCETVIADWSSVFIEKKKWNIVIADWSSVFIEEKKWNIFIADWSFYRKVSADIPPRKKLGTGHVIYAE